jgi:hypothetical protein
METLPNLPRRFGNPTVSTIMVVAENLTYPPLALRTSFSAPLFVEL